MPSACEIYLDRRIAPGETEQAIRDEMDALIQGKHATWDIEPLQRTSWTGLPISYRPFHLAWQIDPEHALTQACAAAYQAVFGRLPEEYIFWDFSTNAVTPVGLGIPTIGFGPGDYKLAHMRDEHIQVAQIVEACDFYLGVIQQI